MRQSNPTRLLRYARNDGSTNCRTRSLSAQLREHALQLHRVGHIALDLELAHHERGHAVELAGGHLLPVVPADLDRGVGVAIVVADLSRRAVEHDRALVAA